MSWSSLENMLSFVIYFDRNIYRVLFSVLLFFALVSKRWSNMALFFLWKYSKRYSWIDMCESLQCYLYDIKGGGPSDIHVCYLKRVDHAHDVMAIFRTLELWSIELTKTPDLSVFWLPPPSLWKRDIVFRGGSPS